MAQSEPDIIVRNTKGQNVLTVEVRAARDFSRDFASDFRQQLAANDMLVEARYLLIASQETGYLWANLVSKPSFTQPDYEFPMDEIINRYFPSLQIGGRLRNETLTLVIFQWLLDLSVQNRTANDYPESIFASSGLLEALKGTTPNLAVRV